MPKHASKIVCAAVLLLAGCALEEKGQWVRADTTEAQWKRDNYECTRDATYYVEWVPYPAFHWRDYHWARSRHYSSSSPRLDPYLYEMCLEARGYTWKPEVPQ
ncbi:MAG TPA: hypothetical protein VLS27_18515 [Gammaproteobacteria bacterium]|nr:hypothetical protein [Gammaproteobacteria bacterium]